jgi:hypothetical protein
VDQAFMDFIRHSIESHDRQIGELTDKLASLERTVRAQSANIDKLVEATNRDAIDINALAKIAAAHERRLDNMERGE